MTADAARGGARPAGAVSRGFRQRAGSASLAPHCDRRGCPAPGPVDDPLGGPSGVAGRRTRRQRAVARGSRLARLAALGLLGVLTLTGCSVPNNEFWRFGWPDGITKQATDMRELWTGSVIAALIVGFLVWGLILFPVVAHRKKGDELPKQTAYNLPLEIVYTILPFLIIAA